jgi:hypothetical protein
MSRLYNKNGRRKDSKKCFKWKLPYHEDQWEDQEPDGWM